jgi:hypothetical protein
MLSFFLILAASTPEAAQALPVEEKLICKREPVTGSLARSRKTCKTAAQWRQSQDQASDGAQRMQERGFINSCGSDDRALCG